MVDRDREQGSTTDPDQDPDQAHREQRGDQLVRPQRGDEEVAQVPRPHLLHEQQRDRELAPEQDVPEQHRRDEEARGLAQKVGVAAQKPGDEAPKDHLHGRPVGQLQHPRPGAAQQVEMPAQHRADPAESEAHGGPRARRCGLDRGHGRAAIVMIWRRLCHEPGVPGSLARALRAGGSLGLMGAHPSSWSASAPWEGRV